MVSLASIFTEKDESITGMARSDPMGLEIVWSGFASAIFGGRINSIANDLRGYTINLFHHWMVYRIRNRKDPRWWKSPERRRYHEGDHPAFSRALTVLLEKIMLIAFCREEGNIEDADAIVGLNNARAAFRRQGKSFRYVLHENKGEVLKRQAQLGFSGRYRTPFTKRLELLEASTGHPVEMPARWAAVHAVFEVNDSFRKLSELLEAAVVKLLEQGNDEFTAKALPEEIHSLYIECFGSRSRLESAFARFWAERLALEQGDSRWLWEALPADPWNQDDITAQDLYGKAKNLAETAGDQQGAVKIAMVCEVEPYLARVARLFEGLLRVQHGTRAQAAAWMRRRYGEMPLMVVAPADPGALVQALHGEGRPRLERLLQMRGMDASDLVAAILAYHKTVAEYRRSETWVQETQGRLTRSLIREDAEEIPVEEEGWVHPYYALGFVSVAQAIRRGTQR